MKVFGDKLYVGTGDLSENGTAQLWRTRNGGKWEAVDPSVFGAPNNYLLNNMTVFQGMLYAVVENSRMGLQLYRSATGNTGSWKIATKVFDDLQYAGQGATGLITFNRMLYLSTEGEGARMGLWRSKDGTTWTPVTPDGFGDAGNDGTGSFGIYQTQLYWGTGNGGAGGQIWRTWDGKNWSKVMEGGFGDTNNFKVESLMPYAGDLYAIT